MTQQERIDQLEKALEAFLIAYDGPWNEEKASRWLEITESKTCTQIDLTNHIRKVFEDKIS